jgi:hypothetical protein
MLLGRTFFRAMPLLIDSSADTPMASASRLPADADAMNTAGHERVKIIFL